MDPLDHWEAFDLVVSNPPYVLEKERPNMAPHILDFEPPSALFVKDHEPLIFYQGIATFCKKYLAEEGEIWVEINEQFGRETSRLFEKEGFKKVRLMKDIHDKERYIHACR
jgi:release factor glutamine methyltransferase